MPTSVKKIAEHSYMLTDTVFRVNQFLLSGSDAALLIDTGYGKKHFFRALKKFSSPLVVANTHLHPDHSGGNFAFDEVFLGREDAPGNGIPTNELADSIAKYYRENSRFPNALINKVEKMMTLTPQSERYLPLPEKIQLRGREISVLSCPGHTPGSVIFSDEATRSLFVGDAINSAFWAFTNKTLKLKEYAETVSSLKFPRAPKSCGFPTKRSPFPRSLSKPSSKRCRPLHQTTASPSRYAGRRKRSKSTPKPSPNSEKSVFGRSRRSWNNRYGAAGKGNFAVTEQPPCGSFGKL